MLAAAAIGYAALVLVVYCLQDRLLYHADKEVVSTPHDAGLSYEAITFKASDDVDLSGWYVPSRGAATVVLFCHGNEGNLSRTLRQVRLFSRIGVNAFFFDYRGFGNSGGELSEEGTYRDAEAAWNFLTGNKKIPAERIVIAGESLGGAVAAWLAGRHNPAALILDSTFTSLPDLLDQRYPYLPLKHILQFRYNTCDFLPDVRCPVLIIHSCDNKIVPYSHGCRLYDLAPGDKEFLEVRGGSENGSLAPEDSYAAGIKEFLTGHVNASPLNSPAARK